MPSLRAIVASWASLVLHGDRDGAFARETLEIDRGRLRVFAPLMTLIHAVHVAYFYVPAAARATLAPDLLRWRDGLVVAHGVMIPIALFGTWIVYRAPDGLLRRWVAPVAAALWLGHGAACASLDQIVGSSINAWVGYCFGVAVIYCLSPRAALVGYLFGAGALTAGLLTFQSSGSALRSTLPNVATIALVCIVLSWLVYAARRREFEQRVIIDRQRAELAMLNTGLERRVQEQVAELNAANARLQAQVRARSTELSLALARLARDRRDTLPAGLELVGRYVVETPIGVGGMGVVYAGRDISTGARVAIKIIQAASSDQLDALRRFIKEAGTAATVSHPAIVRMLHVDVSDDGLLFQVQELVEGQTLSRCLHRPWPPGDAARLVAVLCDALAAAHAERIVHLDVKPANIMLTPHAPGLKLLDFGIAKLFDPGSNSGEATRAGAILGTPAYMAPEQFVGRTEISGSADVYAAGVVLFRLLTGDPSERTLPPEVPRELAELAAACVRTAPTERPDARTLSDALARVADTLGAGPLETVAPPASVAAAPTLDSSVA